MSQPQQEQSLTSSRHSPYSSPFVPHSNPYSPQSYAANSSPQSLFNQKLIPRDYLRSKPSPTTNGPVIDYQIKTLPRKYSETSLRAPAHTGPSDRALQRTPDLVRNGKLTPDSDFSGYDGLRLTGTKSPESVEPSSSPVKSRSVFKPDLPASSPLDTPTRTVMPRTSSIDSAISTVSNASLSKATDVRSLSPGGLRNLIASAGGAENLIAHLLKDKSNLATQNAQLWKLVEKQRALLLGLNKDLERITKERDRYKKKVKDVQAHVGGLARKASQSPESGNEPVVVQSQKEPSHVPSEKAEPNGVLPEKNRSPKTLSPMDPAMMPRPLASRQSDRATPSLEEETEVEVQAQDPIAESPAVDNPDDVVVHVSQKNGLQPINTDVETPEQPSFSVTTATPSTEKTFKALPSSRKAPPKPLSLSQPNISSASPHTASAGSEVIVSEEEPARGRRRTRAEDDRDRELSAMQSEEASRRSTREKSAKVTQVEEHKAPAAVSTIGLPSSPRPQHMQMHLSPKNSNTSTGVSLGERMLAGGLKSPGLPVSPRPMHNPTIANTLPISPRANGQSFPLSPRAPKQPLPVPTNPAAVIDPALLQATLHKMPQSPPQAPAMTPADRLHVHEPPTSDPPSIYRGLAVSAYPNLLLPPNALPSIQVRVASSRLRPSRHSMLGLKTQEDSTVFSLSVISRSSNSELWRVEKIPSSLPQLEQQLKQRCSDLPRLPERKLFGGHSPTVIDARRDAINEYFDELLDTHVDEQAAILICQFLSSDVLDPDQHTSGPSMITDHSPKQAGGTIVKTGYLTKKGKNFGGWKSRYFVLENAELRYYESNGGNHLGTVRLHHAQIGKPKQGEPISEDQDNQFRHAFLVQEPKRKDSTSYMRHVLCAESDFERDEWVKALLQYTEASAAPDSRARLETITTSHLDVSSARDRQNGKDLSSNSPTPTSGSSNQESPLEQQQSRSHAATISGPVNGGVIADASTWGNKSGPHTAREPRDKSYKMSNIFNFKKTDTGAGADNKPPKPRILRHNGYVRPVFGMQLAEAVEYCAPFNVDVGLPAVVYRSIEYLRHRNAANEEGLFRLSGSNTTVRMLRDRFNSEGDVDLVGEDVYHDVHAVASLFKGYLRELPSTLLTRELHVEFAKVLELDHGVGKIAAFNILVHRLPQANYMLLRALCQYLEEVTQHADKNKMSVRNMGIVFSPTLNIPTPVFTLFLNEYEAIFEKEIDYNAKSPSSEAKVPVGLSQTEVRSPRHQTFSSVPTPSHHQTTFPGLPANPLDKAPGTANPGDFGFVPVQPSYESGNYVSHTSHPTTHTAPEGDYSSLNGLLAPDNAAAVKTKRRESAMIFASK